MVDAQEFQRWRAEAERALESARLQASAGIHNWACFAAEQASQLAVKGFLHGIGKAPWGHDLVRLMAVLEEEVGEVGRHLPEAAARRLSRHYIPARYPDAHPQGTPGMHYGPEDAEEALRDAEDIIETVDRLWEDVSG